MTTYETEIPADRSRAKSSPAFGEERPTLPFPVVGIGASAGGLSAIGELLSKLPASSGMAFVVVQHLPPDRESLLTSILSRHTALPVRQIEDGMQIVPETVYVTRPGYTLTLAGDRFQLGEPVEKRGHRHPIDDFFRSLAQTQAERAIVVILSGMGTNGTAGAQAVKAAGGLCIAQDPDSAEFPSMPLSLIRAGYADRVAKAAEIGQAIVRYARLMPLELGDIAAAEEHEQREREHLAEVFAILRIRTGHDFSGYKKPTVLRRIQRRMALVPVSALAEYADFLRNDADEVASLANDLMINVTGFFRDAAAWEALREAVIQPLVMRWQGVQPIRAWVTACSSGEEPYSLAMLLAEEMQRAGKRIDVKIFATDTADKSLAFARAGLYPGGIEGDISVERLDRFFERDESSYRLKKHIREMVVFAPQNVLRDPPFSRVDICTCRNLLIYLEPEVQERVLRLLHFSLKDGGALFVGSAETLGPMRDLFETLSPKYRIYRRVNGLGSRPDLPSFDLRPAVEAPKLEIATTPPRVGGLFALQQALFDQFGPPTIIVDSESRTVFFHGDTTPFIVAPSGEPTRDLFQILNVALRPAAREALRLAASEHHPVSVDAGEVETAQGRRRLTVIAAPLLAARNPGFLRLSFNVQLANGAAAADGAAGPVALAVPPTIRIPASDGESAIEEELRIARRDLQVTIEAYESSTEELKASNEEVISINEELQSANEELETSKEELQSLNEELITVNGQLQAKIMEIESANNDLSNLWSSTNIAVVFLDTEFRIRRFTPALRDLLHLLPSDLGRPIDHFAPKFSEGDLIKDARSVLSNLVSLETETQSHSGAWYVRRTLPYRTADNHIDGVIITFIDISARKKAEATLDSAQARLQAILEQMPAAILMVDAPAGKLIYGNRLAATLFGHSFPLPFVGSQWLAAALAFKGFHPDGSAYVPEEWPLARTLATGASIRDEEVRFARPDGSTAVLSVSSAPVVGQSGEQIAAVAAFWDISHRKQLELQLRESEERLRLLVESAVDYAIIMLETDGRIAMWNAGAQRLLGWSEEEALGRPLAMLFTSEDRELGAPERELRAAAEAGRTSEERMHMRKDGARFWGSGSLTSVHDAQGRMRGFAMIMRDHTEIHRAQEQLQSALRNSEHSRRAAEDASRAKDENIARVSQELRTPLDTIRSWTGRLKSGQLPEKEIQSGIAAIEHAANVQQALIDELRDVSRKG